MNKNILISVLVSISLIGGTLYFLTRESNQIPIVGDEVVENVEIRDGVQYVTVTAQGGYFPNVSVAQANVPTKLIVKTTGTYDCSASLVIRDIGFQKILAPTGEEVIDVETKKPGETLQGLCGMGMYNFTIRFN